MSRRPFVLGAALAAPVGAVALSVVCTPRRLQVPPDCSPQQLTRALAALGDVWDTHPGKLGTLVCKRPGDSTPWFVLLDLAEQPASVFGAAPGRLRLVLMGEGRESRPSPYY